jgi:hypothetical protein
MYQRVPRGQLDHLDGISLFAWPLSLCRLRKARTEGMPLCRTVLALKQLITEKPNF